MHFLRQRGLARHAPCSTPGLQLGTILGTHRAKARGQDRVASQFLWGRVRVKKIEAVIKPFKLDEVKEALQDAGVQVEPIEKTVLEG